MDRREILFRKFGRVGVCLDCEVKDEKIRRLTQEVQHYIGIWRRLSRENVILSNKVGELKSQSCGHPVWNEYLSRI